MYGIHVQINTRPSNFLVGAADDLSRDGTMTEKLVESTVDRAYLDLDTTGLVDPDFDF